MTKAAMAGLSNNLPQKLADLKRSEQILKVAIKYGMGILLSQAGIIRKKEAVKNIDPKKIAKSMEELGGTFIKLGQLLSLRPDLIPHKYTGAFANLQDKVKPFPTEDAQAIVREQFGKPLDKVFKHFDSKPVASASIAQVHLATLSTGKKVAVKIQRPGVEDILEQDLDIIGYIAKKVRKHVPSDIVDPVQVVDELRTYTLHEIDFEREAKHIKSFEKNFAESKEIIIPKIYPDLCTKKVLVMEYIDGLPLSRILNPRYKRSLPRGIDRKKISYIGAGAVFDQIFKHGLFHADPHPGNIFYINKDQIAFLDFGIVGHFSDEMRLKVTDLFVSLIRKDLDGLVNSLESLDFVDHVTDREQLKEDLRDVLGKYYDTSLEKMKLSSILLEGIGAARKNGIKLPRNFVLLGKAMVTVEGLAIELNPEFNIVQFSQPYVSNLLAEKYHPTEVATRTLKKTKKIMEFAGSFPQFAEKFYNKMREGDEALDRIDRDMVSFQYELDVVSRRIVIAVVAAALLISSALMIDSNQLMVGNLPLLSTIGFVAAILLMTALCLSLLLDVFLRKKPPIH